MSLNKVNKNMIDTSYMSNAFVGSIITIFATDTYIPNGCVKPDGTEYNREQFLSFYDNFLSNGKLLTCTYSAHAAQIALSGNCALFAIDTTNKKFKVPLIKDGDIVAHANNTSELGKSYKAGLPDIQGTFLGYDRDGDSGSAWTGAFSRTTPVSTGSKGNTDGIGEIVTAFSANKSNAVYGNSTTVTPEQIRLRHFIVIASAQNVASTIDWSSYIAGLNSKANADMSNLTAAGTTTIAHSSAPSNRSVQFTAPTVTGQTYTAPGDGYFVVRYRDATAASAVILSLAGKGLSQGGTFPYGEINITLPCAKGGTLQLWYSVTGGSWTDIRFVYAIGAY